VGAFLLANTPQLHESCVLFSPPFLNHNAAGLVFISSLFKCDFPKYQQDESEEEISYIFIFRRVTEESIGVLFSICGMHILFL
jgi:hypothetical protein